MNDSLALRLNASFDAVLAENGDLGVERDAFCSQIQETLASHPVEDRVAALDRLVLRDVHLVMGCLAGRDRAIRLFMDRFGRYLGRLTRRHAPSETIAEDVEAQLIATLFTARRVDDPTSARLYSYQGSGTLQGWLRVTARRLVIDILRRQKPESREGEFDRLASPERSIESSLIDLEAAARLRPILLGCIAKLTPAEQDLMRQYYRDGRVLREIGDDLGIDTSSVFRRLGNIRSKVWKGFRAEARAKHGLNDGDLKALLPSLANDVNLDDIFPVMLLALLAWSAPLEG